MKERGRTRMDRRTESWHGMRYQYDMLLVSRKYNTGNSQLVSSRRFTKRFTYVLRHKLCQKIKKKPHLAHYIAKELVFNTHHTTRPADVVRWCIRQHTSAYVSICQHTRNSFLMPIRHSSSDAVHWCIRSASSVIPQLIRLTYA